MYILSALLQPRSQPLLLWNPNTEIVRGGGIQATYLHSGAGETGNEVSTSDHCGVCSLISKPSLPLYCFQYVNKEREGPERSHHGQ